MKVAWTLRRQWLFWILDPEVVLAVCWGAYVAFGRTRGSGLFTDVLFVGMCLLAMCLRPIREALSRRLGSYPPANTRARKAWKYGWRVVDVLLAAWILWR